MTKRTDTQWVPFQNGSKLLLASTNGDAYKARLAQLGQKHRVILDTQDPENLELIDDIVCEALAGFVLLDWDGIQIGGKDTRYTPEIAKSALLKSSRLKNFVLHEAAQIPDFNRELIDKAKAILEWDFTWGQNVEVLYQTWESTNKIPPALERRPETTLELRFYLESFFKLSNFRTAGFSSVGPIQLPDILAYAEMLGYTSLEDRLFFVDMISALDNEYRRLAHDKQERESKSKRKSNPSAGGKHPPKKRLG
jgi:hypothetical protein